MPGNYDIGTAKGRIELDASSLGRASAALRSVGLGMIGVGTAALAGFGFAVKKAADFEQVMSGAQSALGATNKEMEIVKKTALDLGANSIYGATNVAKAIESLAFAGLSIQEITQGAAKATIDLAQASGGLITLDEAGRTVANTMRTFGLEAKDAGHIADELAGAANRSTIDIADMVTSFRYVGPVAHTAGLGIDDMAIALAELGDRGIRGSTAGTSLRGVLLGLVNPSNKARGVLEDLGIVTKDGANIMFDASGKMKSFSDVAQILQDHTKNLTREQKIAAFGTIFQRRALASALVLAEQGAKGFAHYREEIARGGSASQIAATRLDNLKGDIALLKAQLEVAVIKAGTPFQKMLRGIVQNVTKLIAAFANLSPGMQTAILAFLGISGTLLVLVGSTAYFLSKMILIYRTFRDLGPAIKIVIGLFQGLDAAIVANPIGLIVVVILAVIAALYLIYKNWDKIWNFIAHHKALALIIAIIAPFLATLVAIVGVIKFVQANWRRIWEDIQNVFYTVVDTITSAWSSVSSFFVSVWKAIAKAFSDAWEAIRPVREGIVNVVDAIVGALESFGSAVVRQLGLLNRWFQKNVMPTIQAFADLFIAVWERVTQQVELAWKVIHPILVLLGDAISLAFSVSVTILQYWIGLFRNVMSEAGRLMQLFVNIVQAVWVPVWQLIVAVVATAFSTLQGAFSVFVAIVQAIWSPFWELLKTVVLAVWQAIKEIIDAALLVIRGIIEIATGIISLNWHKIWAGIKDILAGVWDIIVAIVRLAMTVLRGAVVDGVTAVVRFITTVPGAVARALGNLARTLFSHGVDLLQGLLDGILSIAHDIIQYFLHLPGVILGLIGDLGRTLFDVGKKLMKGLLDGLVDGLKAVKDFLTSIPGKAVSWKGPPAKDRVLLVDNGNLIMQGLLTGLTQGLPAVQRLLQDTGRMIDTLNPTLKVATTTPIRAAAGVGGLGPGSNGAGDTYQFDFKFGDNTDQNTIAAAKETMTSAEVLGAITRSVRAGKNS